MLSNLPVDMGSSCVRAGVYKCVFCNNQFLSPVVVCVPLASVHCVVPDTGTAEASHHHPGSVGGRQPRGPHTCHVTHV